MTVEHALARAYEIDGHAVSAQQFTEAACDPRRSVVVEACAGSGKTWLLVARILRLLLAGTEPSELLAITFTRKAAQEMRERLMLLLHDLALLPEESVRTLLQERGVAGHEIASLLPVARGLYERVLSSPGSLSIDTFHSWFARLIQIAPLASGVPHGYALTEATGELLSDTYSRFMQGLNDGENADVKRALLDLYQQAGDWNTKKLLDAFVNKRAEWWAASQAGAPLAWLQILCGEDGERDARLTLWADAKLKARALNIAWVLGKGAKRNQERAAAIESAFSAEPSLDAFLQLLTQFCDDKGSPRGNDHRRGKLLKAIEDHLGENACDAFEREFVAIGEVLLQLQRRSFEPGVIALNEALFTVGTAYLERYQAVKAEQRVFDFADLEWHAYRLLNNAQQAAYMQSRLDARYRHILLDEFQDTNPLQWSIVHAWLNSYGADAGQPSVFIVGDPKQSIYRFRRAEPRLFNAARDLLAAQGAAVLRTNQTRRNAGAIVDILNSSFTGNRIFSRQTTFSLQTGAVWRLPLMRAEAQADMQADATEQTDSSRLILRNPLTTPRVEEEDGRRLEEGRAVARAILRAMRDGTGNAADLPRWSDVMLLVKKRTHLAAYERALREAGIPFVSDKRGGLLDSLEVGDLIALLRFLMTPGDNRALAHVLKSPIIGAGDDDLIRLAQAEGATWWARVQAMGAVASAPIQRAALLLVHWLQVAPHLPVHDLLDVILHQGQLIARYAQAASPTNRSQVIGNIEAFTELALNLDAGRYPSLPKFIDALRTLRKGADNDAPDEANIDAAVDAVRILTIHSAKGLEARIVVLMDANHSDPARDDVGILCEWPQDAAAPKHFSAFGRAAERGAARDALFADEEQLKAQEDWNLLYVAVTRAKELLIVSGVASRKNALPDGTVDGSWYARLQTAQTMNAEPVSDMAALTQAAEFTLPLFDPPVIPLCLAENADTLASLKRDVSHVVISDATQEAMDEGIVLHALLERLTQSQGWPVEVPDADVIANWLPCSRGMAAIVQAHARIILSQPQLERFFNPALYRHAQNELEIVCDGILLRIDRLVHADDAIWILDYKRNFLESERAAYQAQLARYRTAALAVYPGREIKAALITVDGRFWALAE